MTVSASKSLQGLRCLGIKYLVFVFQNSGIG